MTEPNPALEEIFDLQRRNKFIIGNTGWRERIARLHALETALQQTYREELQAAMVADLGKPALETDLTELYLVVREIRHAKKHLRRWMSPSRVATPLSLLGTSSSVRYEPKGTCLIISPWNFPVNLTFGPLVSAIAAGNTVVLKPSELVPHTTGVMAKIVRELFPKEEVALVEGGKAIAEALLKLPFDHVFFTGSSAVGKRVLKASADTLASVTLELGGKSPTIVDETANLKAAARKIAWGKFLNAGQICISPDYVLVQHTVLPEFTTLLIREFERFFAPSNSAPAYSRIVSEAHFVRLRGYLEDALSQGASLAYGGNHDFNSLHFDPCILLDVPDKAVIMREEIFGPLLPLIPYETINEVVQYLGNREKPLAMYIYSDRRETVEHLLQQTRAGGSCINTNLLHFTNPNLPFGGIGFSGSGKAHGHFGFQEFSNPRGLLKQHLPSPMELLFPPYNRVKERLAHFTLKYL